jgi:hypothetical protein
LARRRYEDASPALLRLDARFGGDGPDGAAVPFITVIATSREERQAVAIAWQVMDPYPAPPSGIDLGSPLANPVLDADRQRLERVVFLWERGREAFPPQGVPGVDRVLRVGAHRSCLGVQPATA